MRSTRRGFSLIELMIAIVIVGIIAAIAFPDFLTMRDRAKEGATKANMHTFQVAAEDYCVQSRGAYATTASAVVALLPGAGSGFRNPFDQSTGDLNAWKDMTPYSPTMGTGSTVRGIVAYADSSTLAYVIAGQGSSGVLPLHLLSGR